MRTNNPPEEFTNALLASLRYEDGALFWMPRAREHFSTDLGWAVWTAQVLGCEAGSVNSPGYRVIAFTLVGVRRDVLAHRVVWRMLNGEWPKFIDHIDGDRLNNRIENLRSVVERINRENLRAARSDNLSTGLLGAYAGRNGKFRSSICVDGKQKHLGRSFPTAQAAHEAYLAAKRQLHEGCTI